MSKNRNISAFHFYFKNKDLDNTIQLNVIHKYVILYNDRYMLINDNYLQIDEKQIEKDLINDYDKLERELNNNFTL